MGAVPSAGNVAAAPEPPTHAIASMYDAALHPPAGDGGAWHDAHRRARIGATFSPYTGGGCSVVRSAMHAEPASQAKTAADTRDDHEVRRRETSELVMVVGPKRIVEERFSKQGASRAPRLRG
jgi:hypothetical protein